MHSKIALTWKAKRHIPSWKPKYNMMLDACRFSHMLSLLFVYHVDVFFSVSILFSAFFECFGCGFQLVVLIDAVWGLRVLEALMYLGSKMHSKRSWPQFHWLRWKDNNSFIVFFFKMSFPQHFSICLNGSSWKGLGKLERNAQGIQIRQGARLFGARLWQEGSWFQNRWFDPAEGQTFRVYYKGTRFSCASSISCELD